MVNFQLLYKMSFKLSIKPALFSLRKACHLTQEKVKVRTEKEKQLQKVTKYRIEKKLLY